MSVSIKMAGPNIDLPGLEYLRDATTFQMEQVNEYDSPPPSKILRIVSTNSVSYCCTVPNSNDFVIKDEKHGNSRFCINGINLPLTTLYCSANQPFGWVQRGTESIGATDERPSNDWIWKLKMRHAKVYTDRKYVSTAIWNDSKEVCASITVEPNRITWDMHVGLSPVLKALLLSQGIEWAIKDPRFQMNVGLPLPRDIDSLLWVDYTEQLTAEEEAVPVDTLDINGREFIIRPYLNKSDDDSFYGFTLSDEARNVLMMLQYTLHRQGNLKGTLTGFDLNQYAVFKGKGMHTTERFINLMYGSLGKQIGVVRPLFVVGIENWHLINYLEDDMNPNKTLHTNGKIADNTYRFTNMLGELVSTHKMMRGYIKIELEKDLSTETKLLLVCHAVKTACFWSKLHTREQTPTITNPYPLKYPMHLVRTSTGRKAHFQNVFTQFRGLQSVSIRGAFRIADENAIFLHLLDSHSKEVIYTVRCEVGAVEHYLLPFQAEIMDNEGNLVLFAHQPATVPTMMINQKEGNNIGVYEHGQCEADHCQSNLQTDDGDHLGIGERVRSPYAYFNVLNKHKVKIASVHSPCPNLAKLSIHPGLRCDQVMVIVAAAIRESFYMFNIHQNLPICSTLAA